MVGQQTLDLFIMVRIHASQQMDHLIKTIQHIVGRSADLKNKHTEETDAPVEFACIFCQNEDEYASFSQIIKPLGHIVENTETGFTYLLNEPVNTACGPLRLVKIRKPDQLRKERGDADFNTDYEMFKQKYVDQPNFELVKRDNFEMLRLSDPEFDAMACFSSIPKSKVLGVKL